MVRTIAKDYDTKREKILTAAALVFAHHGVASASMAEVAKACGISKGNIYHYYDSKLAILFEILDSYLSRLRGRIIDIKLDAGDVHGSLEKLCAEILDAYEGMDDEHKIQTEGIPLLPEDQQTVLKGYQRDMVRHVEIFLSAANKSLQSNPQTLRAATMSVFGMLNWFYMWNTHKHADGRAAYAKTVAAMTMGGVPALGQP
ncbi:MAG: TetR/AcrR family transcriptional regulator [Parvibaculales bacterium]